MQRDNDKLRATIAGKDARIDELEYEKKERTRLHLAEIDAIKLEHQ